MHLLEVKLRNRTLGMSGRWPASEKGEIAKCVVQRSPDNLYHSRLTNTTLPLALCEQRASYFALSPWYANYKLPNKRCIRDADPFNRAALLCIKTYLRYRDP